MSHVDEGALHAYLDGALDEYPAHEARRVREHLELCAECATRLETERLLRQDASEILGLAIPNVEAPSFEELRAYVKATRPATSPKALRLYRLGWAASIMVALGVGWMVRDGQLEAPAASSSPAFVVPPPTAEGAGPGAPSERERVAAQAVRADQVRENEVDDASALDGIDSSTPLAVGRQQEGLQVASRPAPAAADVEKITAPEVEPAAEVADLREPADRAAGASLADRDESFARLQEEVVAAETGSSDSLTPNAPARLASSGGADAAIADLRLGQQLLGADSIDAGARSAAAEPAPPVTVAVEESRRRAELPTPSTARIDVATTSVGALSPFEDPTVEEEEELDDEGPLVVPGLEVISFANLAEGTTPSGLHILQRLEDGQILDLYQLPAGVDPSVLPPLEGGRNEVRAEIDDRWVVLRAVLSTDALNELLARLDPEG